MSDSSPTAAAGAVKLVDDRQEDRAIHPVEATGIDSDEEARGWETKEEKSPKDVGSSRLRSHIYRASGRNPQQLPSRNSLVVAA